MVLDCLVRIASSVESTLRPVRGKTGHSVRTVADAAVLESDIVDQILAHHPAVGNLNRVFLAVRIDRGAGQAKRVLYIVVAGRGIVFIAHGGGVCLPPL